MGTNGFPSGRFLIINEDSGWCLSTLPGEYREFVDYDSDGRVITDVNWKAYHDKYGQSGSTSDPTVLMATRSGDDGQRWYLDNDNDRHLTNIVKFDLRGRFALAAEVHMDMDTDMDIVMDWGTDSDSDGLGDTISATTATVAREGFVRMIGNASLNADAWRTEDGYIFCEDDSSLVLTQVAEKTHLTMGERGGANQRWRFDSVK